MRAHSLDIRTQTLTTNPTIMITIHERSILLTIDRELCVELVPSSIRAREPTTFFRALSERKDLAERQNVGTGYLKCSRFEPLL